jgi:hypothetical protein
MNNVRHSMSELIDDWEPIIEPASPEECAMIDERMKHFPKDFEPFNPSDYE